MQKTNALRLRQNMGAVVEQLLTTGEPILLEKGHKPVAVLISLEDYKRRFVDVDADISRREMINEIKSACVKLPKDHSSLSLIRSVRTGQ